MDTQRNFLTGVGNIIRFNRGMYATGIGLVVLLLAFASMANVQMKWWLFGLAMAGIIPLIVSTAVSWYVYDLSGFYNLLWISDDPINKTGTILNIHAGFDETSALLKRKFPHADLKVLDFYDAEMHTEVSIERARKSGSAYPGTLKISTGSIPCKNDSVEAVFLIFAAHEIRDSKERIRFFRELNRVLKVDGSLHVVEHLRDLPNFLAYTIGFFHFLSPATWNDTFAASGLSIKHAGQINPFVKYYILQK